LAYYIWGLGLLWKVTSASQIYFYHFDGDGNVVALSGPDRGLGKPYRYDPLGEADGVATRAWRTFASARPKRLGG
jgi:hypothetical protein